MNSTLIVCDSKKIPADLFSCIQRAFGPCKSAEPDGFNENFDSHDSIVLIFSPESEQIQPQLKTFIEKFREPLQAKRVAVLCVSCNRMVTLQCLEKTASILGNCLIALECIEVFTPGESCRSTAPDEIAAKLVYLKRKLNDTADMPQDLLAAQIEQLLRSHNTCTLCTGCGNRLRATPIEYLYKHGIFYFISEGGEKFSNLSVNPIVSIAVYNAYTGFNSLESVQIEGKSELIELFSDKYAEVMELKGLKLKNLQALPVPLHVFQVTPTRFEVLKSDFAKTGYRPKQVLNETLSTE